MTFPYNDYDYYRKHKGYCLYCIHSFFGGPKKHLYCRITGQDASGRYARKTVYSSESCLFWEISITINKESALIGNLSVG